MVYPFDFFAVSQQVILRSCHASPHIRAIIPSELAIGPPFFLSMSFRCLPRPKLFLPSRFFPSVIFSFNFPLLPDVLLLPPFLMVPPASSLPDFAHVSFTTGSGHLKKFSLSNQSAGIFKFPSSTSKGVLWVSGHLSDPHSF